MVAGGCDVSEYIGIINSTTCLHLVGSFYEIYKYIISSAKKTCEAQGRIHD
jgi:hypothetical protein